MPTGVKVLGGLGLLVAGAVALPQVRDYVSNGHRLWQMERALASLPHAPRTLHVSQNARVGLLMGGQGRCDYFVGQLRTCGGSRDAVLAHYRDATIPNPLTGQAEHVSVLFVTGDPIHEGLVPPDLRRLRAWGLGDGGGDAAAFIVYVLVSGPANADPRCR